MSPDWIFNCRSSDGFSFVPFIFQLVCSSKPNNILKNALPEKKYSVAEKRRINAKKKKTELPIEMVKKQKKDLKNEDDKIRLELKEFVFINKGKFDSNFDFSRLLN